MSVEYRPRYRPISRPRCRPIVSVEYRPALSVECRLRCPNIGRDIGWVSTDTIGWVSVEYRPRYRATSRPRCKPIVSVEYRRTSVSRDVDGVSAEISAQCAPIVSVEDWSSVWPSIGRDIDRHLDGHYRSSLCRYPSSIGRDIDLNLGRDVGR